MCVSVFFALLWGKKKGFIAVCRLTFGDEPVFVWCRRCGLMVVVMLFFWGSFRGEKWVFSGLILIIAGVIEKSAEII